MLTMHTEAEEPAVPEIEVGTVLSEKYLIERRLGAGGMGTIYSALNLVVNRRVAIKIMHPWIAQSAELVGRFRTEARAAATIGHPNIIDVFDMGETEDGLPYLVMEYLEGEDLFRRLARTGPLDAAETVCLARQILSALDASHSLGIIHCDLKPENVFLANRAGGCAIVKVLDFGVARFDEDCTLAPGWAWEDHVVGTPAFMSPEQATGRAVDQRTDLYSVGVMIYEMLSGVVPYGGDEREILEAIEQGPPPRLLEVAPNVDRELARIVDRAMARSPSERFATAAALAAALAPFEHPEPEAPSAPIPLVRVKRRTTDPVNLPMRYHPIRWAGLVAAIALALLCWIGPLRSDAERARSEIEGMLGRRADLIRADAAPAPPLPPRSVRLSGIALAVPPVPESLPSEVLEAPEDAAFTEPALDAAPVVSVRPLHHRRARTFDAGLQYGGPPSDFAEPSSSPSEQFPPASPAPALPSSPYGG